MALTHHIHPATHSNVSVNTAHTSIAGNPNSVLTSISGGTSWTTTATASPFSNGSTRAKIQITEEDIVIRGQSLAKTILDIQDRLAILIPNPKLEAEFEQLAELRQQYQAVEQELLEKARAWDILKKSDK